MNINNKMSSKLAAYANLIVRYEDELKNLEKKLADDGKKLVLLAESLTPQLRATAEDVLSQISQEINKSTQEKISELTKKYTEEREKELAKIKEMAQKNLDKATDYVLKKLEEVFK